MLSFLQRHKGLVVVGVLLLLPLVLVYAQSKRGGTHGPLIGVVVDLSGLVERSVLWVSGGLSDALEHYVTSVASWDELATLRRERIARVALQDRITELSIENEALRALANAAAALDAPRPLGARVIGRRGQPLTRLIVLDKGSRHGVRRGDGVLGAEGVVGVVLSVARSTSEVLLVSDASSALDIVVQRSRARGILRGRGDEDRYAAVVEDFDRLRDVRPGDVVVTSGFGARFPAGTRVGVIAEVKDRDDLNVEALIVPAMNLARVEHVVVLVGRQSPPPPALGDAEDEGTFGSGVPGVGRTPQVADDTATKKRRRSEADENNESSRKADGKANDGKANDGKANDGKTNDGKTNDGKTNDGKANDGKANDSKNTGSKALSAKPSDEKEGDQESPADASASGRPREEDATKMSSQEGRLAPSAEQEPSSPSPPAEQGPGVPP